MSNAQEFSKDEIDKAKKNTFILLGNTGNGKSTLTNLLCKSKAKVSHSKSAVTNEVTSYYGKLKDGNYICIIDTPGFNDTKGKAKDKENYELIKNYLINTNSLIKGIYILCNFQDERFGNAEQICVKAISDIFPLKNFWNYVSIVFTHYFDKGQDSRVSIKKSKVFQDSLRQTVEQLIKDICKNNENIESITYDKIKVLYVDIYVNEINENLNNLDDDEREEYEKKIKGKQNENERSYKELTQDIKEKISRSPLYDKVEIFDNEKIILYEENHSTAFESFDLYDAVVERRLFYLNNEIVAIDLKLKSDPKFRANVNKLLHNFVRSATPLFVGAAIGATAQISIPYLLFKDGFSNPIQSLYLGIKSLIKFFEPKEEEKNKYKKKIFE